MTESAGFKRHASSALAKTNIPMTTYQSVLEDIEWLYDDWWLSRADDLTSGELRRGSATLWLLLVEGLLGRAWRHYGFQGQPTVRAPDLTALATQRGYSLNRAAGLVAGGGRQNGIDLAFVGGFRIDHPTTGVSADAESGFAVAVTSVVRLANDVSGHSPLATLMERQWSVTDYIDSPTAVRRGELLTRRDVIDYFRNYAGGAHYDREGGTHDKRQAVRELVAELEPHVIADVRSGLHFELLSIGQAVGRSPDVRKLALRMKNDTV